MIKPGTLRRDDQPPAATSLWGWRFHHLGVPTDTRREGEVYLAELGVHVAGFEASPYGVQWMRYEPGSPLPELIKTVPHLAFEVDDLARALEGKNILIEPNSPSPGVVVAMIVHDGAPIELMQFTRKPGGASAVAGRVSPDGVDERPGSE
jgi:hypothetical protein